MSHLEPPGWSDPARDHRDIRRGSQRARQAQAAPEAYPGRGAPEAFPGRGAPARRDPGRERPRGHNGRPARGDLNLDLRVGRTGRNRRRRRDDAGGGRAGRNLPAAIMVGVLLGGLVLASLLVWRPAFVLVVAAAVIVGGREMILAVRGAGPQVPMAPMLVAAPALAIVAWFAGAEGLTLGLLLSVLAVMVWRMGDGPAGYGRDVAAAAMIAVYLPFLGGFAVLLVRPADGVWRVLAMLAAVVLSDTGGYIAGVFLGRHPMAPSVSPKKSWEGLVGSLLAAGVGGAVLLHVLLDRAWWHGAIFGVVLSLAAIVGDLAESMLKRDLGVKDMSSLLPGHGGLMDRLDSILFAAPAAYLVLALL